ncbi:MAG: hypothetical protein MI923_16570 [Phycisphaerales bacterium]|nr:hypothetical protein [Phycisphaerales bacterium]
MSARTLLAAQSVLFLVSASFAQTPKETQSHPPELVMLYRALVNERVEFVGRAYQLNKEQEKSLQSELEALIPDHIDYMDNNGKKLRLRTAAVAKVLPTQAKSTREKLTIKYQDEIYEIHTKAPLSSTNAVKRAEGMLSKAQIDRGRAALAKQFAKELKGAPLDIEKIDRLVLQPVQPEPKKKPKPPAKPKPTASTQQPPRRNVTPQKPRTPPPPLPKSSKESQTKPPEKLEPAPPVDTWQTVMDKAISQYDFSAVQQESAKRVLNSCRRRAEVHLKDNKEAYEQANQTTSAEEKSKKLKELNRSLDKLYSELNNRLESIATIEQKHASAARKKDETEKKDDK